MNIEAETLLSIYSGFLQESSKHISKRWTSVLSYLRRVSGSKEEFYYLLTTENGFRRALYNWVSNHIKINNLDSENVIDIRIELKLFKEELARRNIFVVLFVMLLAISTGLYNHLDEVLGAKKDTTLFLLNSLFGVFAVLERAYISKHIAYCSQLDALLEKWVQEQSEANKAPNEDLGKSSPFLQKKQKNCQLTQA